MQLTKIIKTCKLIVTLQMARFVTDVTHVQGQALFSLLYNVRQVTKTSLFNIKYIHRWPSNLFRFEKAILSV